MSPPPSTPQEPPAAGMGRFGGMKGFSLAWIGQVVSLVGTSMTRFAIILWAWQTTGKATTLTLITLATYGPAVLLNPVAGALVDRWSRKRVMIWTDCAAGLTTLGLLALLVTGRLEIYHIFISGVLYGIFEVFQFPAYSAAITMMLPERHYARASGMMSIAQSASNVAGPLLAGTLIAFIQISGVLVIDVVTFVFAVSMLLLVSVPQPPPLASSDAPPASLWQDSLFGIRYLLAHPHLLLLQVLFFFFNLISILAFVLLPAMVLARTGDDQVLLGGLLSVMGAGGLAGGLLLSLWGGPKRRIHGVLVGMVLESLGILLLGLGHGFFLWALGGLMRAAAGPVVNGCNQAIWQAQVPAAIQGRVFTARRLIAHVAAPLAMVFAGPAADWLFEPAMMPGGGGAEALGWLVGTGKGAGMKLIFVISGVLGTIVAASGFLLRPVRDVEDLGAGRGVSES